MENVEDFILNLPSDERAIASMLRTLIYETDPRFREKLSYGVPYYSRNRRVCFIWPASAPQGPKMARVSFGFCFDMLSSERNILLSEGRKQVYIVRFSSLKDIDERALQDVILEAVLVDDLQQKNK
jgi:hypothetical protein